MVFKKNSSLEICDKMKVLLMELEEGRFKEKYRLDINNEGFLLEFFFFKQNLSNYMENL